MNKDQFLKEIYYNKEIGLKSPSKFYKFIKEKYPDKKYTVKEIKDFVESQKVNQVFQQVKNTERYNEIKAYFVGDVVNFDLMDMNYYKNYNKGYRFILVCIDVYSRRVFLRALMDKSAEETMKAIKDIEKEFLKKGYEIKNIICDNGKEFKNSLFFNHFKDIKDHIFFKDAEIHNSSLAIIDRCIRTLRDLFKKVFAVNDNWYWLNDMYRVERNYNNTFHGGINQVPTKIWNGKKLEIEPPRYVETLEIGDKVRVLIKKNAFEKKNLQKWSNKVYKVAERDGVGYRLLGLSRKYFIAELLKVNNDSVSSSDNTNDIRKNNRVNNRIERLNRLLN